MSAEDMLETLRERFGFCSKEEFFEAAENDPGLEISIFVSPSYREVEKRAS